jgi:hypothetical protein
MKKITLFLLLLLASFIGRPSESRACDGYKTCLAVADCVTNPKWHDEMMRVQGSGQGIADDTAACQHKDNPGNASFDGDSAACMPGNWEIIGKYAYSGKEHCGSVPK